MKKHTVTLALFITALGFSASANPSFIRADFNGIGPFELGSTSVKKLIATMSVDQGFSIKVTHNHEEFMRKARIPGLYFLSAVSEENEFIDPRKFPLASYCAKGAAIYASQMNLLNMKASVLLNFYQTDPNSDSGPPTERLKLVSAEFLTDSFSKKIGELLNKKYGAPPVEETKEKGDCASKEDEVSTQKWVNTSENFSVTLIREVEYDKFCQAEEPDHTIHYKDENFYEVESKCDMDIKQEVISRMENEMSDSEIMNQL